MCPGTSAGIKHSVLCLCQLAGGLLKVWLNLCSEVVKQLLEKGYTVRGTVRSKANTSKVQHLLTLADALPGKLELFEADLLKAGDFDEVVRGADFVLHTASPFFTETSDPQKDLVDPAVNGTTTVLNAAGKAGIKRVVVTSSVAGTFQLVIAGFTAVC